jgi:hypothetical protein
MLASLEVSSLLEGVRGGEPVDREAAARAIVALSHLATELGDVLDALDVNPLRCGPKGCSALDALILPRTSPASPGEVGTDAPGLAPQKIT